MAVQIRTIIRRIAWRKKMTNEDDLCPIEYDMQAINDRMYKAMVKLGKTRVDIATLYGMDPGIPLAMQPPERVPRPTLGNIAKLSGYLGVSVKWLLHGEAENDVDIFVMGLQIGTHTPVSNGAGSSAAQGGAIISGAMNSTVVVQHMVGDDLSAMEREIISAIRKLPVREQATVISYIFSMENATSQNM